MQFLLGKDRIQCWGTSRLVFSWARRQLHGKRKERVQYNLTRILTWFQMS